MQKLIPGLQHMGGAQHGGAQHGAQHGGALPVLEEVLHILESGQKAPTSGGELLLFFSFLVFNF